MKTLLDEYNINLKNIFGNQHKLSTKKSIIEVAKEFPTYFARLYPVTSGQSSEDMQYLAISHSGIRLVRREKSLPTDYLQVLFLAHLLQKKISILENLTISLRFRMG